MLYVEPSIAPKIYSKIQKQFLRDFLFLANRKDIPFRFPFSTGARGIITMRLTNVHHRYTLPLSLFYHHFSIHPLTQPVISLKPPKSSSIIKAHSRTEICNSPIVIVNPAIKSTAMRFHNLVPVNAVALEDGGGSNGASATPDHYEGILLVLYMDK